MRTLAGSIESSSAPVRDVRRASRRLAAILLPIGPAAVALLRFVLPYFTTDQPAAVAVATAPATQSLVLWLGFVAVLTLIPGVLAAGRLTRRYLPRLTAVALFLLVPGYISLAWLFSGDLLLWSAAESGIQAGTAMRLF